MYSHPHEGSSEEQPIIIPDEPQSFIGREVEEIVQQIKTSDARLDPIPKPIDDTDSTEDGWAQVEADYDQEIQNIESIDLTQEDDEEDERTVIGVGGERKKADARCEHYEKGTRNPCLCGSYQEVSEHTYDHGNGNNKLKTLQVHGLKEDVRVGRFLVDFVEIRSIWVHQRDSSRVLVRGLAYTRTRNLDGRVQAYQNEVCQVMQVDTNDPRPDQEQAAVEVTLEQIRPEPRILHRTNKPFPECRFELADFRDKHDRETRAPLICRWQHVMHYPDRRYRRAQRPVDGEVLRHFVEKDIAKKRHRGSDLERLNKWRGCPRIRGGSYVPNRDYIGRATEGNDKGSYTRVPGQKYTAADMFSGAGGVTKGAKKADFRVLLAVDHWPRCNATYRANHPDVELREVDIMDFCNDLTDDDDDDLFDDKCEGKQRSTPLDLVHLSPPCQTWSPAHTVSGRNDPANIAALSACQHIVHKHRPRLLTFEQTFGIIQERHLPYFNALVQSLTRYGYSLRWKVFPLVQFGLPQNRKRLILVGAAPGEPLPGWPAPTHGDHPAGGSGRQRLYVSAVKACQMLREGENMHDVEGAKELRPRREPWDGHRPMNRTITTSGGQSYHWDGERELTLAEFARLQGFPYDYKFVGPCIKKQIGNAFPPCVVRVLMGHLRRHLEESDRVTDDVDFICVNDDDDDDDNDDNDDDDDDDNNYHEVGDGVDGSAGHLQPFLVHDERKYFDLGSAGNHEDAKDTLSFPRFRSHLPPSFEYLNAGLDPNEAWRIAVEESKRDDRRRSTAGSSVMITGSKQLVIEVNDDDDDDDDNRIPDLVPYDSPSEHAGPSSSTSPFSARHPPSPVSHHIDPSVLTLGASRAESPSPFPQASLPHHYPPSHYNDNNSNHRRHDSGFFDTQGYAQVFPIVSHDLFSPSAADPSSSRSRSITRLRPEQHRQLDPRNYEQVQEAFQRNDDNSRRLRPFDMSSSSSVSASSTYQGNMSWDDALAAALRASMLQQRQQLQQDQHDVTCRLPELRPKEKEEEEVVEEEVHPKERLAAASKFFGPWNPPVPPEEDEEDEPCEGKGKGKAVVVPRGQGQGQGKDKEKAPEPEEEEEEEEVDVVVSDPVQDEDGKAEDADGDEEAAAVPRSAQIVDADGDTEMGEDAVSQVVAATSTMGVPREERAAREGGVAGGKFVAKRSYDGADEDGSPSKKGRTDM